MLQDSEKISKPYLLPPNLRWLVTLAIVCIVGIGTGVFYLARISATTKRSIAVAQVRRPIASKVNALGRLEPVGEVIKISAPTNPNIGSGSRVTELLVNEGDSVRSQQIIAILDNRNSLQASLLEAQKQVQVAQLRLAQVKAGAKPAELAAIQANVKNLQAELAGEIQSQKATIARLEAELQNADIEFHRNQALYKEGAIAASALDSRRLALRTAQEQLNSAKADLERTKLTLAAKIQEAKATWEKTAQVRPVDVATAQAEVDSAVATVEKIQAELDLAYVRAPKAGKILRIQARPGETVGNEGIVELGQTEQMYAIAEIYESDIAKIRPGQTASITSLSNAFPGKLSGKVDRIGLTVAKKDVLDTDPTAATDARVIEAKIRLDKASSRQVASLTNLQVNVEIDL
ncbi:ABC exporter membrane fusion protein [Nostocaceae cyanobacterium CENA369]|uniref:ABC exporter membrane fusion protein n=1 Tax=Dendronalium phyllosphericum CENA369 TaxID=1725256 RepID=A0A8J7HYS7_9NOST|nr:ABC exporter membrane fusion protein [Dendronalium phyllosphericum]MBH8572776.1 ABC exporter membrane fusion protein [Dendronalium phyllosphericum CENA369]